MSLMGATMQTLTQETNEIYIAVGDLHINAKQFTPHIIRATQNLLRAAYAQINSYPKDYFFEEPMIRIVFLGDLVNTAHMDEDTMNTLMKLLGIDNTASTVLIRGNHDNSALHPGKTVWDGLRYHYVVPSIIEEPIYTSLGASFVPHVYKGVSVKDCKSKLIFGHLAVEGVELTGGCSYTKQDVMRDIPPDTVAVLGHLHTPMVRDNIIFPGSVCPTNWSDDGRQRKAYIFGLDDDGNRSGIDMVTYEHLKTKTVYREEDILDEPNTLYRLVVPKLPDNVETLTQLHNLQVSVAKSRHDRHMVALQSDTDIVKKACVQAGVEEAPVMKVLKGVGAID